MKKTIVSLVLMLIAVCGWAQNAWETPTSFFAKDDFSDIKVSKVEFLDKETVVHINILRRGQGAFQFVKETYLRTPDGKHYLVTNGKATCEEEKDLPLGEWYHPTAPNTNLALHFEPLPTDVERFHLIEGDNPRALKIWNITEGKQKEMSGFSTPTGVMIRMANGSFLSLLIMLCITVRCGSMKLRMTRRLC